MPPIGKRFAESSGSRLKDGFPTDSLAAVKYTARNLAVAQQKVHGMPVLESGYYALAEMLRRIPGFRKAWEDTLGMNWLGDDWYAERFKKQSTDRENKPAQMKLAPFCENAALCNTVYSCWEEWVAAVARNLEKSVTPIRYLYLLSLSSHEDLSVMDWQKPGITNRLVQRYAQHKLYALEKNVAGKVLWVEASYALTATLGKVTKHEAERIERECLAAVGDGAPASWANEWFECSTDDAVIAVAGVLRQRKIKYDLSQFCRTKQL